MGEINKGACAVVKLFSQIEGDLHHSTFHFADKVFEGSAEECLNYLDEKGLNLGNEYALVKNFKGAKELIQKERFEALQRQETDSVGFTF